MQYSGSINLCNTVPWRGIFQNRNKRRSKRWICNGNAKFIHCVLQKSSSHMHIYIHIDEELFQIFICRTLFQSANPKIEAAMAMPCSEIKFRKWPLHKYVHRYAIIDIMKSSLLKHNNQTWHFHCKAIFFWEWRLTRFGKRSSCQYI